MHYLSPQYLLLTWSLITLYKFCFIRLDYSRSFPFVMEDQLLCFKLNMDYFLLLFQYLYSNMFKWLSVVDFSYIPESGGWNISDCCTYSFVIDMIYNMNMWLWVGYPSYGFGMINYKPMLAPCFTIYLYF